MDDKRLERIEIKLDDISDHLSAIDVTLGQQHISLKEHIRRTNMLEKEVRPIKKHVDMIRGGLKLLALIAALAGIIEYMKH